MDKKQNLKNEATCENCGKKLGDLEGCICDECLGGKDEKRN